MKTLSIVTESTTKQTSAASFRTQSSTEITKKSHPTTSKAVTFEELTFYTSKETTTAIRQDTTPTPPTQYFQEMKFGPSSRLEVFEDSARGNL